MRTRHCPICRTGFTTSDALPFCSSRCRSADLGGWLGGQYCMESRPDLDMEEGLDPALVEQLLGGHEA